MSIFCPVLTPRLYVVEITSALRNPLSTAGHCSQDWTTCVVFGLRNSHASRSCLTDQGEQSTCRTRASTAEATRISPTVNGQSKSRRLYHLGWSLTSSVDKQCSTSRLPSQHRQTTSRATAQCQYSTTALAWYLCSRDMLMRCQCCTATAAERQCCRQYLSRPLATR